MKNKFLSILLALCLCLTLLPTAALAEDAVTPDYSWYEGDTSASEFTISDINDLLGLANLVNGTGGKTATNFSGKTITLAADIDLSAIANWTPIGKSGNDFAGSFDGGNHTISGLCVNNSTEQYQGLFGRCKTDSTAIEIKNLTVSGSVSGRDYVGGVIGFCYGKSRAITVSNCHFSGTISAGHPTDEYKDTDHAGGVIGYCIGDGSGGNITVSNCSSSATVTSNDKIRSKRNVGGVIGICDASDKGSVTVKNCANSGDVIAGNDTINVGGVVGYCVSEDAGSSVKITGCANSGNVSGSQDVGGVVGYFAATKGGSATVENCANSGNVTGSQNVGGVVGECHATMSGGEVTVASCLNTGTVSRKAGSDKITFGAVTGARESANDKGTVTVSDCYYLSGCIASNAGFTGDPDTGLTALAHKITTTLAEAYDEDELRAAAAIGAKEIKLMRDIALTETLTVTGDNEITLDLNGHVLSLQSGKTGSVIRVGSSNGDTASITTGKLTLTDSSTAEGAAAPAPTHKFSVNESTGLWTLDEENGTRTVTGGVITGGKTGEESPIDGGVCVYPGSSFTMNGGTIVGNTARTGGGVCVDKNSVADSAGTFTMNGGAIIGNTASSSGGGVCNKGSFTMTGGSIEGNSGSTGGGVHNSGTFTMTGGSITGNSGSTGGGVCSNGSFTMSGDSEISDNEAVQGGGVYVGNGTFTMNSGSISGNSAATTNGKENSGNGGGVYVEELLSGNGNFNGTFNLAGGSITGNSATNHDYDVTGCGSGNVSAPNQDSFKPSTDSKTVTFKTDENTIYGVEVLSTGATATEPAQAPTRPNDAAGDYAFGKWYEKDAPDAFDFTNTTITSDLTLYAKWLRVIKPEHVTVYIDGVKQTDQANAKAAYDGKEHTVTFKVEIGGTTLNVDKDYTVTGTTTGTELSNYEFSISGMGNYDPNSGWTGGWKIVAAPVTGGSSSAPTYSVTAPTAANGTVKSDRRTAEAGETVTITVTPDKGYTLETLTVLDKNGKEIALTDLGNGKYSFKMPAGKVTVNATFMDDNSMLNFFVDVPADAYYYDAVLWAAKNGITGGIDENHFAPYASCTRGQLVTFLYRWAVANGVDVSVGEDTNILSYNDAFTVPEYAIPAFQWAVGVGIVQGNNGDLLPNQTCTRAQAVAFLFRFAAANGMDFVTLQELVSGYSDAASVPSYALSAFNWALAGGIVQGNDGNLMPSQPCTRAQIVTMLYRLLGK